MEITSPTPKLKAGNVRRLLKEMKRITSEPIEYVNVGPIDESTDLFKW